MQLLRSPSPMLNLSLSIGPPDPGLEEEEAPEHLQYIDGIVVWGDRAEEVFEKGKKILQIPLKADFAVKEMKVKGRAQEILLQAGQGQGDQCSGTG